MRQEKLTVATNEKVAESAYLMRLSGNCRGIEGAGQFIDIKLDRYFLRRPISIYDFGDDFVYILYKTVGGGTFAMSNLKPGEVLDVLLPLGNGFDLNKRGEKTLLVGGGIGMPPMYLAAKGLRSMGVTPQVVIGFNSDADVLPMDRFQALGIEPVITTVDGSYGIKGFVTDAMKDMVYDYVYCCGPSPMLKAVFAQAPDGQFSFEERMGCGFGACMGCSIETKDGYKRVCADGPVFFKDQIIIG